MASSDLSDGLVGTDVCIRNSLKHELNRDKAGLIGLSTLDFDQVVLASLSGLTFDQVSFTDGEEYPLNVRIAFDEEDPGIEVFNRSYFNTATLPLIHS